MSSVFFIDRKIVLMTGFGPFNGCETNPSWEGLKSMDKKKVENKYDILLIRREIAVKYDEVDKVIPLLWSNYQPHLTIHVGLSEAVSCFVLETQANRDYYTFPDVVGQLPFHSEFKQDVCDGPSTLVTQLDVAAICRKFNCNPKDELHAKISSDAGRFLCEYIYYTSLCRGRSPTLFVHVPLKKYTSEQLAQGLERILELCLQQLTQGQDRYYSYSFV